MSVRVSGWVSSGSAPAVEHPWSTLRLASELLSHPLPSHLPSPTLAPSRPRCQRRCRTQGYCFHEYKSIRKTVRFCFHYHVMRVVLAQSGDASGVHRSGCSSRSGAFVRSRNLPSIWYSLSGFPHFLYCDFVLLPNASIEGERWRF